MNWKCCCFPLCTSSIDILDNLGNVVYVLKGNQCCCPVGFNCARLVKCCDIPFTIYKEKKNLEKLKNYLVIVVEFAVLKQINMILSFLQWQLLKKKCF